MFSFDTTVKLHDTDAAGLLFYGNQFKITHDAYEAFLESIGCPLLWIIDESSFFLPIVHAEADYHLPLAVGDKLTIELTVDSISAHSFVVEYKLTNEKQALAGRVSTVHVSIDKKTRKKIILPEKLKTNLQKSSQ